MYVDAGNFVIVPAKHTGEDMKPYYPHHVRQRRRSSGCAHSCLLGSQGGDEPSAAISPASEWWFHWEPGR